MMLLPSGDQRRRLSSSPCGDSTFLDVDFGELPPPVGDRHQLRAVVTVHPPPIGEGSQLPSNFCVANVEIINNRDGRTQFAVFTNPAVIRGFNPQPDPPLGQ